MADRHSIWKGIWAKKYETYQDHELLHVAAGYDMLSYKEWQSLVAFFLKHIPLEPADRVLEVGCGCGAFLQEISARVGTVSGVDYSAHAIDKLKSVMTGDFRTSDAANLDFSENSFDVVMSFGVFFYFKDLDYAISVLDEMRRVLTPMGTIFIGEISDKARQEKAERIRGADASMRDSRKVSSVAADHLYYPISFFEEYAREHQMNCKIIDENDPVLDFYPNSAYRFSVILSNSHGAN